MKIINVSKQYDNKELFRQFNLDIEEGKVTAIMGSSGVGKTTLLKMIANVTDYQGTIETNGQISYVFGESSLIPALTVKQNLDYVTSHVIKDKIERHQKIKDILLEVELSDELNSYPNELSSGMAQRVSLARGFLYPANTIIMDEPFRGLDTSLKSRLQKYFLKLLSKESKTVILITHDLNEALLLSDRIVIFGGRPVELKADVQIDIPKGARALSDPEISSKGDLLLKVLEKQ